jgi:chromosome partitioning protein
MQIIAVANQKGGCGKTTTTVNLAAYLALNGKKTLLVDLDPQGSSTRHLGINELDKTMYDVLMRGLDIKALIMNTMVPGLDLAPTNNFLGKAELELASKLTARESVLRPKLRALDGYDYVIIDTPPTLGFLTLNALVASDIVLIPIQTQFFALMGLSMILDLLELIKNDLGYDIQKKYLLTIFDPRTKMSKEVVAQVRESLGEDVFKTVIPNNIRLAEAPSYGLPVSLHAPDSPGALAYADLAKEVIAL